MKYYGCNEDGCEFQTTRLGFLKGHLVKNHNRADLADAKAADLAEFEISEEEFKKQDDQSDLVSGDPDIEVFSDEPATRLRQVLEVNLGEPETIKKVCKIFALSPWMERDLSALEKMLVANFGVGKKLLVQNCLAQYSRQPYNNNNQSEDWGQGGLMTIYDSNNNPMRIPTDRGLIEALRNKAAAEARLVEFQSMREMMGNNNSGNSEIAALQKKVDDLVKALTDQKISRLEERVKLAEEAALHSTDGKGVLDVMSEAGADLREGAAEAGKELKESIDQGFATLSKMFSKNSVDPIAQPLVTKSPERIAMILEAENHYMKSIHEPGY